VAALRVALAAALLAILVLAAIARFAPGVRSVGELAQAVSAAALVDAMTRQNGGRWPAPETAPPPGLQDLTPAQIASAAEPAIAAPRAAAGASPDLPQVRLTWLRAGLAVDSLLLMPSWLGALLLCVALVVRRSWSDEDFRPWRALLSAKEMGLHLLCVVPVVAASFDIAENGLLIRSCEDAVSYVLSDDLVRDRAVATTCKWALLAASGLLLAVLTLRARPAILASIPDEREEPGLRPAPWSTPWQPIEVQISIDAGFVAALAGGAATGLSAHALWTGAPLTAAPFPLLLEQVFLAAQLASLAAALGRPRRRPPARPPGP
jgi:hypothetical protein